MTLLATPSAILTFPERPSMSDAEKVLADCAKGLNLLIGGLLSSGSASIGNSAVLLMCQSAQSAEQAVVQIRAALGQNGGLIAQPQMMPGPMPFRKN